MEPALVLFSPVQLITWSLCTGACMNTRQLLCFVYDPPPQVYLRFKKRESFSFSRKASNVVHYLGDEISLQSRDLRPVSDRALKSTSAGSRRPAADNRPVEFFSAPRG